MRNIMNKGTLALASFLLGMTAASGAGAEEGRTVQKGKASWYGPGFHGRLTANGERFNTHAFTAAHKTLPFGTKLRVTHQKTGQSVVVRINDRGPYAHGRVIDLSKASAEAIGLSDIGEVMLAQL
jgi:rare lipoprotein A